MSGMDFKAAISLIALAAVFAVCIRDGYKSEIGWFYFASGMAACLLGYGVGRFALFAKTLVLAWIKGV